MNIEVKEMTDYDFIQAENLIEELYAELGESPSNISRLASEFMNQLAETSQGTVLLVKSFITGELITLATLTESQAVSGSKYGVLDEVFTAGKFSVQKNEEDFLDEVRRIGIEKNWSRIDVAAPTDAWYRTVRFHSNQKLRLTTPKFKRTVNMQKVV